MSKKTLILCAVALFAIVIISLTGNIITIGDKAMQIHPAVGWTFYTILWLFVLRFIAWPTLKFLFTPELKGDERERLDDMEPAELARYTKNLAMNQQENDIFAEAETPLQGVRKVLEQRDKEATSVVRKAALNVFIVTAISQNGSFDIITAMGMNLQMINRLVAMRHRRPSLTQLLELYVIVISSTLIISRAKSAWGCLWQLATTRPFSLSRYTHAVPNVTITTFAFARASAPCSTACCICARATSRSLCESDE